MWGRCGSLPEPRLGCRLPSAGGEAHLSTTSHLSTPLLYLFAVTAFLFFNMADEVDTQGIPSAKAVAETAERVVKNGVNHVATAAETAERVVKKEANHAASAAKQIDAKAVGEKAERMVKKEATHVVSAAKQIDHILLRLNK
jgi:hypothetical protein